MNIELYEQFYRWNDTYRFSLSAIYLDEDGNEVIRESNSAHLVYEFENMTNEYAKSYLKYLINKERQEFFDNLFKTVIGESTNEKIDRMFPDV